MIHLKETFQYQQSMTTRTQSNRNSKEINEIPNTKHTAVISEPEVGLGPASN